MADAADIAANIIDQTLEQNLSKRKTFEGESAQLCEECEDEIPLLRRQTLPGVKTCVYCQQLMEDKNHAYQRPRYSKS